MMPSRLGLSAAGENLMWISWCDHSWIPILSPTTVMDYFSEKSNPFYDRTCNNEIVKMQRLSLEQLNNMVGIEYILLHVQDPILYVIRKQHRHTPKEATPMADYYIIAGTIYQAPDLASVFNSRLLATVNNLQAAFEEASSYARYHPSKGYSWDFSANKARKRKKLKRKFISCLIIQLNCPVSDKSKTQMKDSTTKEESSSMFQRQRVDMLLGELTKKFPIPQIPVATVKKEETEQSAAAGEEKSNGPEVDNIKTEKNSDMRPPEKKMKFN